MPEQIRFHQFPLNGVDAMTAATVRSFPRHTHDQYGIGVIDSGGHASSSDKRQVEAGPGNLIFVNPGEVHDGRAIGGRSRSWRMLYIDPILMRAMQGDISDNESAFLAFKSPVFKDDQLRRLFDASFRHINETAQSCDPMPAEATLLRLAARMMANSATGIGPGKSASASIRKVRDRIDADPSAPFTLTDLAKEIGLSRYQLIRAFALQLDLTPHAYILQRRLSLARRLIRDGQALAEVAAVAGFFDQSHLTRCFVRQFGVTPARYRLA